MAKEANGGREVTATVLVPTHEHGPLLTLAVGSALQQTVEDIEVFVVCDGATDDTLEAAEGLVKADDRVRLFIHDKGPRHGEIYRHQALQEAAGAIVCYLADDDLWLPNHVATMVGLLETADFAHAYPIGFHADGQLYSWPGHFSLPASAQSMSEGHNFFPLSCVAHTLELYRRLPHGWRTSPPDMPTDIYMWNQILSVEGARLASGNEPTVLHFSSRIRGDKTIEDRFEELEAWGQAASALDFGADLERRIRRVLTVEWADSAAQNRALTRQLSDSGDRLARLEIELEKAVVETHTLEAERDNLRDGMRRTEKRQAQVEDELGRANEQMATYLAIREDQVRRLQGQLDRIRLSRTWRIREALLRIPGAAWLARRAGAVRSP